MASYVQRYESGERRAVWNELHGLGPTSALPAEVRTDIDAVARRTIERANENLIVLHRRLCDVGYHFELPKDSLPSVVRTRSGEIAKLAERKVTIPATLRAALELFGDLSFRGWPSSEGSAASWSDRLLDPFEFMLDVDGSLDECDDAWQHDLDRRAGLHLAFAGDYLHKNDISGGAPSVFLLPSDEVDAIVAEDLGGPTVGMTTIWFVDYLRAYFEGGGFRRSVGTRLYPAAFLSRLAYGLLDI